jgi:hypothetical protein
MSESRAICVLGMHRSGTSALAKVLNILGVDLGPNEQMLQPHPLNPKGFWEQESIMNLNERLLGHLGGNWYTIPNLPDGWEDQPDLHPFREEALETLGNLFGNCPLWGFKDPRTCITLPFWRPLVPNLEYIVCLRNPRDVALSLSQNHGIPIERGAHLWMTYILSALRHSQGGRRCYLFFENLLEDPRTETNRLAGFLGFDPSFVAEEQRAEIRAFLEIDLCHHQSTLSETLMDESLPRAVRSSFMTLGMIVEQCRKAQAEGQPAPLNLEKAFANLLLQTLKVYPRP